MRQRMLDNLGLKLLSVFLAILLWAVVLGEQKVEMSLDLPYDLPIPPRMMMVGDTPETLEVHLRGPRTLVRSLAPREVSLRRLAVTLEEGENLIPIRREIVRVPRGLEVVDVTPHRLRVILERMMEREIEVLPQLEGAPPEGFAVRQASAAPSRIALVGPAGELKRVNRLRTLPVSVEGRTAPFAARVQVELPGGRLRFRDEGAVTITVEIGPARS